MSDQFSLFGDPLPVSPSPKPKKPISRERERDRLLLLTYLRAAAAERGEAVGRDIGQAYGLRGSSIKRAILHVTLQDLGMYDGLPPDLVAAAAKAASEVHAYPFEAEFDVVTTFGRGTGERALPVVLWRRGENNPALRAFQQTLVEALKAVGLPVGGKFNPHVTVRWDRETVQEQAIAPVRWTVSDFALVHSIQGEATHITLDQWPLIG